MKKFYYIYAIAILALFGACTEEGAVLDDVTGGLHGTVKAEFTISFPSKAAGETRMTAETVQATGTNFRGIQDIMLFPFLTKVANIDNTTTIPGTITLKGGAVSQYGFSGTDDNLIVGSSALYGGNNAHLYQDIEIEIGTRAFMFYGMAVPSGVSSFANGTLSDNLSSASTLGAITFSPVQIRPAGTVGDNGTSIASYLTGIANVTGWSSSTNVILKTLYENFITMKAGSWTSVKASVQQLYTSLYGKTFADAGDNTVKTAILTAITTTCASDSQGGAPDGTLEFQTLGNYPADINLPDGAAYVNWDGSAFQAINFPEYDAGTVLATGTSLAGYYERTGTEGNYTYTACNPTGTADGTSKYYKKNIDNTGLDIPNLNKFVYPAPLYYRVLSDIRTSQKSMKDVYESITTWDDVDHSDYTGSVIDAYYNPANGVGDVVQASTRSIAIEKQVQYAVARLDATVQTNGNATILRDNAENAIPISDGASTYYFPVTGILIGGQKDVDYKFEQKSTGDAYTVYDNMIDPTIYLKSTAPTDADKTHTLVLESKEATANDDPESATKIAVEFQNNSGQIIVGRNNTLILPGTKFYLVGVFDPYDNTSYNYTGTSTPIKKTFVQDYITTANLSIKSLKNAYNTLPDLRSPELELGLSIDIGWQNGITQTVVID